jgi:hypothetical protein
MTKTLLLYASLLCTLVATGCAGPDGPADNDQLVFQVCLRDSAMAATRRLDFTIIRPDKRDIEPAMAIGTSVKLQPIFEAVAASFPTVRSTVLSIDRTYWYGFEPPKTASLNGWSDWQSADYVSRTTDIAYKLEHGLPIDRAAAGAVPESVKVRYRMMHYKDVLATRASRRLELARTDFVPC